MREVGLFTSNSMMQDTDGYILFMANTLGWSRDEIMVYSAELRREIRAGKRHGYIRQRAVWARKPEST